MTHDDGTGTGAFLVLPIGTTLAEAQLELTRVTLRHCNGDKHAAAAMLGVCLKTLYNYLGRIREHPVPYPGKVETRIRH